MNSKNKLLLAGVASVAILTGGAAATQRTLAAENTTSTSASPVTSLVEKLASKFNLNKDEVQAVFNEEKATREVEMHTKMKARTEERLTAAVSAGILTQAQKDLITNKLTEVKTKIEENRKITDQGDQRAAMDQLQADLSKWAADNDIDRQWIRVGGGPGERGRHGHGPGGPDMKDPAGTSDSTTTSS